MIIYNILTLVLFGLLYNNIKTDTYSDAWICINKLLLINIKPIKINQLHLCDTVMYDVLMYPLKIYIEYIIYMLNNASFNDKEYLVSPSLLQKKEKM